MQVTEKTVNGLEHNFEIKIPAQDVKKMIEQKLLEKGKKSFIPGFRPDKAPPLFVLENRFKETIQSEIIPQLVRQTVQRALQEKNLLSTLEPRVKVPSYESGKDLIFSFEVEVLPKIDLTKIDLTKLTVEHHQVHWTEKDTQRFLDILASQHHRTEPLKEPRPVRGNDILIVDLEIWVEGTPLKEKFQKDMPIAVDHPENFEDLNIKLKGAKAGDTVEAEILFTKEMGYPDFVGKKVLYKLHIKEIQQPAEVPVDDQLAQELGFDNLDKLKEKSVEYQKGFFNHIGFLHAKRQVLDGLEKQVSFPLPKSLVDREVQLIQAQAHHDEHGGDHDHSQCMLKELSENEKKEYQTLAERRVRLGLLLADIGSANKVALSQEELAQTLMEEVKRYPKQEKEVIEYYRTHPQAFASLTAPKFEDKVIEFILTKAQVKKIETPASGFDKLAEEEELTSR